ncbi:hypothetical protein EVAR_4086_1 [Eumeta japonica]|uniref:Uncharacterized protein n=1 Tax=Eumeta variegata TaxID=151549 RepID=A0A4C1T7I4_EUMVA|nr:hypothetical protein EVAR_4086_1 [Eumeta japonica]
MGSGGLYDRDLYYACANDADARSGRRSAAAARRRPVTAPLRSAVSLRNKKRKLKPFRARECRTARLAAPAAAASIPCCNIGIIADVTAALRPIALFVCLRRVECTPCAPFRNELSRVPKKSLQRHGNRREASPSRSVCDSVATEHCVCKILIATMVILSNNGTLDGRRRRRKPALHIRSREPITRYADWWIAAGASARSGWESGDQRGCSALMVKVLRRVLDSVRALLRNARYAAECVPKLQKSVKRKRTNRFFNIAQGTLCCVASNDDWSRNLSTSDKGCVLCALFKTTLSHITHGAQIIRITCPTLNPRGNDLPKQLAREPALIGLFANTTPLMKSCSQRTNKGSPVAVSLATAGPGRERGRGRASRLPQLVSLGETFFTRRVGARCSQAGA